MILVGQDRTTAYNFDNVYDLYVNDCRIVVTVGYEERKPLESTAGAYESTERAMQVFNDLINAIGEASVKPIGVVYLAED